LSLAAAIAREGALMLDEGGDVVVVASVAREGFAMGEDLVWAVLFVAKVVVAAVLEELVDAGIEDVFAMVLALALR
jgi:hypothetical protein